MSELFLDLIDMSLLAIPLIVVIAMLRPLLRRAPKNLFCALWALVGIRLIFPFSFESSLSLIPFERSSEQMIVEADDALLETHIDWSERAYQFIAYDVDELMVVLLSVGICLWGIGMAVMFGYMLVSALRMRYKVREAIPYSKGIYLCDNIPTSFILNTLPPRIYLSSSIDDGDRPYVIAHERAHLKRLDHIWKPLGFAILCVHWWNPFVWLGYMLFCRDIEFACDEKVLCDMGSSSKKPYSTALVNCSAAVHSLSMPLSFGTLSVKHRVRAVLDYKKPRFWLVLLSVLLCVALAVGFLTDPVRKTVSADVDAFITETIVEMSTRYSDPEALCYEAHDVLGVEQWGEKTTIYMVCAYQTFELEDGAWTSSSAGVGPRVITVRQLENHIYLTEYWSPRDGAQNSDDIKERFPWSIETRYYARTREDHDALLERCDENARAAFEELGIDFPEEESDASTMPVTTRAVHAH